MKRRSFFSRVFGLAAASAVAPEVLKAEPAVDVPQFGELIGYSVPPPTGKFTVYLKFDDEAFKCEIAACIKESIELNREGILEAIQKATYFTTPLDGSRE